jgi:putative tryptophan/tyrosine transport system permease protein
MSKLSIRNLMLLFKFSLIMSEGLIFGLTALGVYVAFQWLRFPDLTPDGSFSLGAVVYVTLVTANQPPLFAVLIATISGGLAGLITASINQLANVPSVVAGLLVSSGLYSINWLILGKPNQFLEPAKTLIGDVVGMEGNARLLAWLFLFCFVVLISLAVFAESWWGLRCRAIGENPLLSHDLKTSEQAYTILGLVITNAIVALSGTLFAHRSFSADINMGLGVTISALSGIILGVLIYNKKNIFIALTSVLTGAFISKIIVFLALEAGIPAESFRLLTSITLLAVFLIMKSSKSNFLKGIRWN